ncbi:TrkA family potassium uptake protein [Methanoregula sp.]|uniref:potassium channel family protein n=1 Tax=Methanoregula sp. TaxID=2052170 RepID=UPI00356413BA
MSTPPKRGRVWRVVRNSPGIQISIYFLAFATVIGLYTYIFHGFYPALEGKPISWTESLLFVVESMTTVGYGGLGRFTNDLTMLLAIQLMISGVIMIFIVVPLLLAPFLTTLLAPAPPRRTPHALTGHTVIFGYDEITKSIVDSLTISDHDIVIIEEDKAAALNIATQYRRRAYVVWGEYTDPATWESAHLDNASFVVICKNERLTASIILGIRKMAKGKIISVVDKLSFDRYLRYAGADYVLSPKHSTGRILARHAILNPMGDSAPEIPGLDRISINLEHKPDRELRLINIPVVAGCRANGRNLKELDLFSRYGIIVFSLWKAGVFVPWPKEDVIVDDTTSLFLFGRTTDIVDAIQDEFESEGIRDARAVIAGFGDVGSAAYRELSPSKVSCFVVDLQRHEDVENQVVGNAEDERLLREAGIESAQYCIVALNNDDVNMFTTLMARNLNPGIRILARANEPASVDKLYRAGADYVALLPMIGGQTIGRIILSDLVTILLDLPNGDIVILVPNRGSEDRTVGWFSRKSGVRIIGIESTSRLIVAPAAEEILLKEDTLVAVGSSEQLKMFLHQL